MNLLQRLLRPFQYREGLDLLLAQAPEGSTPLRDRLVWLERLVTWVRTAGPRRPDLEQPDQAERVQTARLKYVLRILARDPELARRTRSSLRSIVRDTGALELFMHVGVPNQQGFIGEFIERLNLLVLPQPPGDRDLVSVFSQTFRVDSDAEWIAQMDPTVFEGWMELFSEESGSSLIRDAQDALLLLSQTAQAIGASRVVRHRVAEPDFRKHAFFVLVPRTEAFLGSGTDEERFLSYGALAGAIRASFAHIDEVHLHFRKHGTTIELVYQIGRLKALLKRISRLSQLLVYRKKDAKLIQEFLALLVRENLRARKIRKLVSDNLDLIAQKIVETNAETGEHYITRDRSEQWEILRKSWGGGALTGVTTLFKFLILHLSAPPFVLGLVSFTNYAVSFIGLQALGFTLATKQPAMTATSLATQIEQSGDSPAPVIDEIVHLLRSQLTAVMGNILGVIPVVIAIDLALIWGGSHLTDAPHAQKIMESFSLLGPTPLYAAGTGVLLWLSSVFSGWFCNWFSFRGLPLAIKYHHRLRYMLGVAGATRVSEFLQRNIGGLASNLSLAFLLAMTPQFASFFGFPFDVRHVTLSSGALTASAMAIGPTVFRDWSFWLAVGGVLSMAVLNLAVAFALALTVAIWAKEVSAPRQGVIYRGLLEKLCREPWVFLFPGKVS